VANGHGGARPGAGRKKKPRHLKIAHGTATIADRLAAASAAPAGESIAAPTSIAMPDDLSPLQIEHWKELAPLAIIERTLNDTTRHAFTLLCKNRANLDAYNDILDTDGYTIETEQGTKAHPLLTARDRMVKIIDAQMARFKLTPFGKEVPTATKEPPVSKLQALRGGRS
jgi:phage terminase small subunit